MSLRPRYSLLTLLLLTTFVAGGVKLWYGPHHVVEQPRPKMEVEYTYRRGFTAQRIFAGPHVERVFGKAGELRVIEITYYRGGTLLRPRYLFVDEGLAYDSRIRFRKNLVEEFFTEHEITEFEQAIQREKQRLHDSGNGLMNGYY